MNEFYITLIKGKSYYLVPGQRRNIKKMINFSKNYEVVKDTHKRRDIYHSSDAPQI